MKNEGFTLVELLAVLLILAFIAIIAVPQILNLIEESKIKSLKISTSEYIRAVNISLANEEMFNNVKDGLYTIADNGKKIVLGDREIYIASEGHGLKSGLLLIEDSKVKRVLKGMIDDYYARVNGEEITILKNLNESTLVSGTTFNARIKNLVGDKNSDGTNATYKTADTIVKKIIFLQDSVLPEGYTKEQLETLPNSVLSAIGESIKGYYDAETGTIYVYSDGYISCPTSINSIFQSFGGVEEIELNLIDTSKVIYMSYMFLDCTLLKRIDLIGFDTSKVNTMERMFHGCSSLEYLDLSGFNTSNVTLMGEYNGGMFMGCTNLKEIKGIEDFDVSHVTDFGGMFSGCSSLTSLDLSKWDMRKAGSIGSWCGGFFTGCKNLKSIKFGKNFTLENVTAFSTNGNGMFYNCSSLEYLDISMFNTSKVVSMVAMFQGCTNLKEIKGIEKFKTSNVTNMNNMFANCSSLTKLDVSNFNTSQVTNMSGMFGGCSSLTKLDVSHFNTGEVTGMNSMFARCSRLTKLDVSHFDTSKVTSMGAWNNGMFENCSSLEELDLTSFDTSKVTSMREMFAGCTNLKVIKVSKKWVENEGAILYTFNGCGVNQVTCVDCEQ